jgi:hypothetical protein
MANKKVRQGPRMCRGPCIFVPVATSPLLGSPTDAARAYPPRPTFAAGSGRLTGQVLKDDNPLR